MASAPALLSDLRCADAAPGRHGGRAQPSDRLVYLLALSLLMHLALLAWPYSGQGIGGTLHAAVHGAQLTATLAGQRAFADQLRQAPGNSETMIERTAASDASPTPREPAADAASVAAPLADAAPPPATPPVLLDASLFAQAPTTLYYPAEQLSVRPRALAEPLLDPDPLATIVASGEIALTLWIDEQGNVTELDVERSDLPEVFVQTAAEAFRELRFAPGEIDGHPVGSVLHIAVRYDDERLAGDRTAPRDSSDEPAT